ncbi:MAG: response regulator [Vicinamibacteria bacterium]|nr:response regulator [Vicinamibacteria bacterium]
MSEEGSARSAPPLSNAGGGLQDARTRAALLSHVRHELRTPVNAILGYSEMLIEDAQSAGHAELVPDLQRVNTAGQTLLNLINVLIDPEKIKQDASEEELAAIGSRARHDLRTPVNAVLGYSEMLLEDLPGGLPENFRDDLTRVLDSGKKLLGLIDDIVRFSAAEAGGAQAAQPSARVSSMIQDAVGAIRPLTDRAGPAGTAGGRILAVDDNEINCDMLKRRLEREGYEVGVAINGRVALDRLASESFDLVLLDILMPEMNGYEVLTRLKADESLRHIPVIMISAIDEIDSVVRCIEIGAEDYLPKPFNPVLLRARIGACLEKKHLRDREVLHLKQIEEEKRRADELLHVILPNEIVDELKSSKTVRPRRYENVAVLFCDVVGFTPYCAGRDPEEVVAHLQELVEAYEVLALRYGMQKIKTIGDSFMATAGAILVGLRQYLFDLWGDTVNTAARVESHGKNGAVNLSAAAWRQVSDICEGVSQGLIKLKGIGDMEVFRVERLKEK